MTPAAQTVSSSDGRGSRDTIAPKLTLTSTPETVRIFRGSPLSLSKANASLVLKIVMIYGDITDDETSTPCEEDGTFSTDVDVKNKEEGRSIILEQSDNKGNTTKVSVHLGKFVFVLDNIKQVALGVSHSCALTNDGEVKCWGRNNVGQLGNNSTTDSSYPVDVHTSSTDNAILSGIKQIATTKGSHNCALTTAGKVKCWGNGGILDDWAMEKLADSNTTPVDVCAAAPAGNSNCDPLEDISAISLGGSHACALTTGGNVKCWGYGRSWAIRQ